MEQTVILKCLLAAVEGHLELRLVYGEDSAIRRVFPHALGLGRTGSPLLVAWQEGGVSHTRPKGWKHFKIERIRAVDVSGSVFSFPSTGFNLEGVGLVEVWSQG